MMKSKLINAIISLLITGGIILMIFTLSSCSGSSNCDGKKCKTALGLDARQKTSVRDSLFNKENPDYATKFNVYVESSASMDGYVVGNTDFKTVLYRLIGQVEADVLKNDNLSLNYINSHTFNRKETVKEFTDRLSAATFSATGGDRANSDIIQIISQIVKKTGTNEVSMFVSDCVYSPEASADIDKALQKQQTDMLNILKNKAKNDSRFGVLLYRLISDFHGIYYTKTNGNITCDGKRPYFVWFFGDEAILSNVAHSISKVMSDKKADFVTGIPGYSYLPYKTKGSDHAYHYLRAETKSDSTFTFSFLADMNKLPLSQQYIMNKDNYHMGKDKYFIKSIEKNKDARHPQYDYKYTVCIKGKERSLVSPTTVEISLKSMLDKMPSWVTTYDDPDGNDYNNGYVPSKLRTFGLKSLVDGMADYYKEPYYVTFKIKIN